EGAGGSVPDHFVHGGVDDARRRLGSYEARDLSTTATAGGDFVPTGVPAYVGDDYATALRNRSVLQSILTTRPLPDKGMTVKTPRLSTGTAVAVQTENTSVQETDIVEALVSAAVITIAGLQDVSQQLLDRSDSGSQIDAVIARDLGEATGTLLDSQTLTTL